MIAFCCSGQSPVPVTLPLAVYIVFLAFPRANVLVATAIALLLGAGIWMCYGMLSAAMPRPGGDYLYGSRLLSPAVGFASNVCAFLGTIMAVSVAGWLFPKIVLGPGLGIMGAVTGNNWWTHAAATVTTRGWTFALASAIIIITALISAVGTKVITRTVAISYVIALLGFLVSILVLLFTSHTSFVHAINTFSKPYTHTANTYAQTVAAGAKAGVYSSVHSGYSLKSTIGATFFMAGYSWSAFWGVYLAGEAKGAGRRRRQFTMIFTAGWGQGLLLLIAMLVFFHTVGYHFFAAAASGQYAVPVSPYANFFTNIVLHSGVLAAILVLAFLGVAIPSVYNNMAMCQRAPLMWGLDGVVPGRLATVDPRRHTPTGGIIFTVILAVAGAAWASYTSSFDTVVTYVLLFSFVPIVVVGLSAVAMPRRRDLYAGTPADWRVRGIAVLPVVGAYTAVLALLMSGLALYFHTNIGVKHAWIAVVVVLGTIAAAVAWYFAAKAIQAGRGVDIALAYKTIPDE